MADRIISEIGKQEYRESQPQATRAGWSRRKFLTVGGTGLLGILGAPKAIEAVRDFIAEKPKEVYLGEIEILLKDINLRGQPRRENVYYGDFSLNRIKKINGVEYHGENVLAIKNGLVVEGTNPDNEGDKGTGKWLKVRLEYEGLGEIDAYMSLSEKTRGVMKFKEEGGYKAIKEIKEGNITTAEEFELPREKIGLVSFKQSFSK